MTSSLLLSPPYLPTDAVMRVLKKPLTLLGKMNLIKPDSDVEDAGDNEGGAPRPDFEAPPSLGGSMIGAPPHGEGEGYAQDALGKTGPLSPGGDSQERLVDGTERGWNNSITDTLLGL